jgi:hypothetical protein
VGAVRAAIAATHRLEQRLMANLMSAKPYRSSFLYQLSAIRTTIHLAFNEIDFALRFTIWSQRLCTRE